MFLYTVKQWLIFYITLLFLFPLLLNAKEAYIAQAVFSTGVKNHAPNDSLSQLSKDINKLYFFTDIRNYQGHTLTHQWLLNGWVIQSMPFPIKGNRWRVSSNKSLKPHNKGTWTVKVLDENNTVLQTRSISYSNIPSTKQSKVEKSTKTVPKKAVKKKQSTVKVARKKPPSKKTTISSKPKKAKVSKKKNIKAKSTKTNPAVISSAMIAAVVSSSDEVDESECDDEEEDVTEEKTLENPVVHKQQRIAE